MMTIRIGLLVAISFTVAALPLMSRLVSHHCGQCSKSMNRAANGNTGSTGFLHQCDEVLGNVRHLIHLKITISWD